MRLARGIAALAVMILVIGGVAVPSARQAPAARGPAAQAQPTPRGQAPAVTYSDERAAQDTRRQLDELLDRYPPALGRVLKLDPSLLTNQPYLSDYPALASFLAAHPEVAHNPGYFLAGVQGPDSSWQPDDPRSQAFSLMREILEALAIFTVLVTITGALIWLIKTLIDWRRWSRLSRLQSETHNKLLDRFASNQELLAYIETPAGRRFLESGPVLAEGAPRPLSAPVSRILWSSQAGVVLTVLGLGLQFVSRRVMAEVSEPLWVFGVLALALGLGFVMSAVAAYFISRRMGLFEAGFGRSASGPAGAA
ncbi:MAG TPA: hypothetical protein VK886_12860 [Vicinamibacterales bacterium]|nr:hypothetical protein [Vicinamibacterales bacterium]